MICSQRLICGSIWRILWLLLTYILWNIIYYSWANTKVWELQIYRWSFNGLEHRGDLWLRDDGINGFMEALRRGQDRIKFMVVRYEESAAFMACAYAKYTKNLMPTSRILDRAMPSALAAQIVFPSRRSMVLVCLWVILWQQCNTSCHSKSLS